MDYSFSSIIRQVNLIDSSKLKDEIKLRRSGELFYQGSINLLEQAKIALSIAQQQEINLADTSIDDGFSQFLLSLTQQSISTSFLAKYLIPQPKAAYQRESSIKTQVLSSTEAISLLEADLIESEVISLAHDEDINAWIDIVTSYLQAADSTQRECPKGLPKDTASHIADAIANSLGSRRIHSEGVPLKVNEERNTLSQISKVTGLSIAQVFISLLFGNFEIIQSGDFYEGFKIEVKLAIS